MRGCGDLPFEDAVSRRWDDWHELMTSLLPPKPHDSPRGRLQRYYWNLVKMGIIEDGDETNARLVSGVSRDHARRALLLLVDTQAPFAPHPDEDK